MFLERQVEVNPSQKVLWLLADPWVYKAACYATDGAIYINMLPHVRADGKLAPFLLPQIAEKAAEGYLVRLIVCRDQKPPEFEFILNELRAVKFEWSLLEYDLSELPVSK